MDMFPEMKPETAEKTAQAPVMEKNPLDEMPKELFYPVTVPHSGIWLQGKRTHWFWPDREKRKQVEIYLQRIQASHEEIRLEVTNYDLYWRK